MSTGATTAKRAQEADGASVAFQIALTQIGAKTIEDAITLWQDVPPNAQASTLQRWLDRAVRLVLFRRQRSQQLAVAYYRLARALRTGTTVPSPYVADNPTHVSLNDLRREFKSLVDPSVRTPGDVAPEAAPETPAPKPVKQAPEPKYVIPPDDDDLILQEEIDNLSADLKKQEQQAAAEVRQSMSYYAVASSKQQKGIDPAGPASEVDERRKKAHDAIGNQQAANAARLVQNGGRSAIYTTGSRDKRVIGWIRLSRTGTPCGWCAMLMSRGLTLKDGSFQAFGLYRTEKGAHDKDDPDKYHNNCNCYAEPVYSEQQLNESPLLALNREYARQWPSVTRGLGGDAALSAWRNFIRRTQKAAQEAA